MLLDELIKQFNKFNRDLPRGKGRFELMKKRQLDRQTFVIGVYNRETFKNYFDIVIEELYYYTKNPILIISIAFRTTKFKVYEIVTEEIVNLLENININLQTINRIYNQLRENIPNLKRTRNYHIFKFKKYIITIKDDFKLKISEYRESNEYTSLLVNNEFYDVDCLLDFIDDYELLINRKRRFLCCWY